MLSVLNEITATLKLSVLQEVERGELGITSAARKYGIQNSSTVSNWFKKVW
jgi:transposase-like protein